MILRAMSRNPFKRYPSMTAFAEDLERLFRTATPVTPADCRPHAQRASVSQIIRTTMT
jgi:hypothetical protein